MLAALIARWARFTRDGDMVGGDFPSWILSLFSDLALDGESRGVSAASLGLTDRRGECIYAACPHYRRCFIERSVRAGRNADIVIANHALVLHQAAVDHALGVATTEEEEAAPGGLRRIVFDEGHHLFDAADSAFSGHLTALETAELRRWLRGPESERRRGRGLAERIGDLVGDDEAGRGADAAGAARRTHACRAPVGRGACRPASRRGRRSSSCRWCASRCWRGPSRPAGHTLETDCLPLIDGLAEAAGELAAALIDLKRPMPALAAALAKKLDDEAEELSTHDRGRIEAVSRSLQRRGELMVGSWIDMLTRLLEQKNPLFVEWFAIEQAFGREHDVGLHSHWVDPDRAAGACRAEAGRRHRHHLGHAQGPPARRARRLDQCRDAHRCRASALPGEAREL